MQSVVYNILPNNWELQQLNHIEYCTLLITFTKTSFNIIWACLTLKRIVTVQVAFLGNFNCY